TAGAADPPPVCGILVVALRVVAVIVGSIDAHHPSSHIVRALGKSVAFPDATALCRGVAAGERENPFVSWVSATVNVNTTKAHESTSPRLRERTKELRGYESICFLAELLCMNVASVNVQYRQVANETVANETNVYSIAFVKFMLRMQREMIEPGSHEHLL
ncbi:hypothetical protein ALC60_13865, partial [Trachymyrmex zeteki]